MNTTEQDQSHGNAKETTSSNSELIELIPIENTPFNALKAEDKWYLVMGRYRLTEPLATLQEVQHEAQDASWHRIMQIIQIMIEADKTEEARKIKNAEQIAIHEKLKKQS